MLRIPFQTQKCQYKIALQPHVAKKRKDMPECATASSCNGRHAKRPRCGGYPPGSIPSDSASRPSHCTRYLLQTQPSLAGELTAAKRIAQKSTRALSTQEATTCSILSGVFSNSPRTKRHVFRIHVSQTQTKVFLFFDLLTQNLLIRGDL